MSSGPLEVEVPSPSFFSLPSSPSFFPSARWHGPVWIREKHTRAPWRPIEGPYEGSLERGGGVGGLYLSANLGGWSSAKKRKAVGRRGHGRGPMREGEGEEVANGSSTVDAHTTPVPEFFLFLFLFLNWCRVAGSQKRSSSLVPHAPARNRS